MPPSYCPLGRACTVLWARLRIQSTHESGWLEAEVGQKKVASDKNFSRSHRKSQPLVIAALIQVTFAPGMIPGVLLAIRKLEPGRYAVTQAERVFASPDASMR